MAEIIDGVDGRIVYEGNAVDGKHTGVGPAL